MDGEDGIISGVNSQLDPFVALILRARSYNYLEILILALVSRVDS